MSGICGIDHHRGAMIDGSRGFQRPDYRVSYFLRRGATIDGSRVFQRPGYRVPYFLRRGATVDGSRGFQPTVTGRKYSFRRGATVDPVASRGVASGFMRRSATRFIVGSMFRGLKPTATLMRSRRDEEVMPMAADEWARRMEKNLEGVGV